MLASSPPAGTGGLYFDGTNDYVTFGPAPALGVSNLTIEVWFQRLGSGTTANTGSGGVDGVPLVTKGRGENDTNVFNCNFFLGIRGADGVLTADFEDSASGANHPVAGATVVQSNVWNHAAVTYDGTNWVVYLNGQSNGAASTGGATPRFDSIQHAALGTALNSAGTPSGYFDGVLDEARIWNYARSAAQISNSFQLQITNAAGLIARWALNETNGVTVFNDGTSGVHGTRTNGPVPAAGYPFGNPPPPNQPPAAPVLVAPLNGLTNTPLNTTLAVQAVDPDTNTLTVAFYGRAKITNAVGPDFNLIALPDTQYYSSSLNGGSPAIFQSQTDWIVSNRLASNIVMVTHLGDIVQNGDNGGTNSEWLAATNAMYRLENPLTTLLSNGIPYGVTVGNHDQSPRGDAGGTTTFFNQFFGVPHFIGYDYFGGNHGTNNDNNFVLFSASGMDFILVNLEFDPTPAAAVLNWANNLLKTYSNRRAIVTSHYLVGTGNPASFGPQGQATYDALKGNRNLFLMLCGHVHGEGRRVDTLNEHAIPTVLSDYQDFANGGNGWLRIMTFSPSNNVIRVKTYSPWLNQFRTNDSSQFDLPYLMAQPAFAPIGTNVNVASGANATVPWTNLAAHTEYEWYTVVGDGSLSVTSAVWTFKTGSLPAAGSTPLTGDVIINEYSADNDANGNDYFELLVLKNSLDLRGLRVSDNEITNAGGYVLNSGEAVYVFGSDNYLANLPAGTLIAVYTLTNGVTPDTNVNAMGADWKLTLAPGAGITISSDGLGGAVATSLGTAGDAIYVYLPGPDGNSGGTDNLFLDYVAWETSGSFAPPGIASVYLPGPADNAYFTGTNAAQSDVTNYWATFDGMPNVLSTPGLPNPGQNLDALRGTGSVTNTLSSLGAFWKYLDNGSNQGTNWRSPGFNDAAWSSGPAQLGYGDGDEATVVGFGPVATNKHVTTYFRRAFQVANAGSYVALALRAIRDDGIAVFLNGVEVFRNNLAAGAVYNTYATANVGGADESTFYNANINPALLVEGANVLAVEIHQDAPDSSDISFQLDLTGVQSFGGGNPPPQITLTAPTNGATFIAPADITLTAAASDSNGVAKVEFFAAGAKIGEDTNAPFSLVWSNVAVGTNALFAVATDGLGATNVSQTIAVRTVNPSAGVLTRGPYLQMSTPTSIVVRWRTDVPTDSRVRFGMSVGALNLTNDDETLVTDHAVTLTNLQADTRYFYSVGGGSGTLAGPGNEYFFLTHPPAGTPKPVRLWVIGDAGTADANQVAVRDAFTNFNGTNTVHAWLQLGDNAYNSGTDAEYQAAVFNMYSNLLRQSVTWPTLGNHDANNGSTVFTNTYPYFAMFSLPTNAEAGGLASGVEHYYSFDLGMVHFICLDSQTADRATNGPMATWLRADLAATTNRWVIAFWHHPPYSKGSHNSDTETQLIQMRQNFLPILEAGGVDLALAGHSHCYERSFLINGHDGLSGTFDTNTMIVQPGGGRLTNGVGAYLKPENFTGTPIPNRGAVYITAGSSGQIDGGLLNHPAMFVSLNQLGSLVLDITSNRLDAVFLREAGAATVSNDWFTIVKTNFPPVASNANVNIAADATTNLTLTGSDLNRNTLSFGTNSPATNGLVANFNPATGAFSYTPARGSTNGESIAFMVSDGATSSAPATLTVNIVPPVDLDGDGMADAWEAQHTVTDPNADPDGDGATNLQEYWAGTDPNDPLSWLHFTAIDRAGAGYVVTWSSVGGTRYRVLYGDGDVGGGFNGAFTPIVRLVHLEMDAGPVGVPGTMSFTDNYTLTGGAPAQGQRYYRVEVVR